MSEIILQVITILIGFYLVFFKSYFEEKGKSIATKEDIGEITNIVEGIKDKLSHSLELFRISYSGVFKEKIDVYRTLLTHLVQANGLVQVYNYSPVEENAKAFMLEINELINYTLINRPFINDKIVEKITMIREALTDCYDNFSSYYNLSKVGYSGPQLVERLQKALIAKGNLGSDTFKNLQEDIVKEIRDDLNIKFI